LDAANIRQYEHLGDQMTAIGSGDVDGVINDVPVLTPYAAQGYTLLPTLAEGESFGFMVKKGNTALLDQINATVTRTKGDGTFDALVAKWFTTSVAESE
jgi:polar amino acid transport system substrate-binding protein